MFGLLNEAEQRNSLDPDDYAKRRGRFYLIWNASKISGRPALVALMAGNAAHDAETTPSTELLAEINDRLQKVFPAEKIAAPEEVIVTRWKRDPFTRGTYSYVGPRTRAGDYDLMAEPVGNLHFAGEATCGTHPATVHGAFLSGLRVASDVMGAMAGPIDLPTPLVGAAPVKQETGMRYMAPPAPVPTTIQAEAGAQQVGPSNTTVHIKQEPDTLAPTPTTLLPPYQPQLNMPAGPPKQSVCSTDSSFWATPTFSSSTSLDHEATITALIYSKLGPRPLKPARPGVNPFLLFTKAKWEECKTHCASTSSTNAATGRDAIRATLGRWWKAASEEEKSPYLEQSESAQRVADEGRKKWEGEVEVWDREAGLIRREWVRENAELVAGSGGKEGGWGGGGRKSNNSSCVVLDRV